MTLAKLSVAALALVGGATAALKPITMKGTKFFVNDGEQFYMKGIAYQEDVAAGGEGAISDGKSKEYIDPLADEKKCERDVPYLKKLNVNTIRTYAINPEENHDACMKLLDDAGIYVISDLSQPYLSINRDDAKWDTELFQRYKDVVDVMAQYTNTIGFFAGNEVSNNDTNTEASAFVKAAVRDTKKYIKDTQKRWLGVGYASNDDADIRGEIANYFNCGDAGNSIDYWGYNIYSWCGDSNMQESGYDKQVEFFSNYSVPVFFAEYGCNNQPKGADDRTWTDTDALYSDEMTGVFSGGIVYMYFNETNDFGVVQVTNGKVNEMTNFKPLAAAHKNAKPKTVKFTDYSPKNSAPQTCPGISDTWKVSASALPPTPNDSLCECMVESRTCVPKDNLATKDFKGIFDYICAEDKKACAGITQDAEAGIYGAYSMCSARQKLAHVMDAYYTNQGKAATACDHDGKGTTQSPKTESKCTDSLEEADAQNEKVATATSALSDPASTGGSDSGDNGNFGVPSATFTRVFALGDVAVGLYMVMALGVGAGVALL